MSYSANYIITTLSSSLGQYGPHGAYGIIYAPIIPPGRIRQTGRELDEDAVWQNKGAPYTVVKGNPGNSVFPFGKTS